MRDSKRFGSARIAAALVFGIGTFGIDVLGIGVWEPFAASSSVAQETSPAGSSESSAAGSADTSATSGQTTDQPPVDKRYALVKSGEDILRIDRKAGSVSFCSKSNDIWRCVPAPLAEDAYQAEIASLADEIDGLNARIKELEAEKSVGTSSSDDQGAPGAKPKAKKTEPAVSDKEPAMRPAEPGMDDRAEDGPTRLSNEDEEQLDEMLQFSEKAMRRFFGLMKDLKSELERPAE